MALFGDLNRITFAEVVKLLKKRCGSVVIETSQVKYVLHVNQGHLVGARVNDQTVQNRSDADQMLKVLHQAQEGTFVFSQQTPETLYNELDIVLDSNPLIPAIENNLQATLPHPDTRFRQIRKETTNDQSINYFLEQAQSLLFAGASANEIAKKLLVDVHWVQYYLYRLRLIEWVQPIRESQDEKPLRRQVSHQKTNLFSSLMGALRLKIAR